MRYSPPLCRSFGKDIGEPFFQGRSRAERLEIATSGSYQGPLSFELLLYIPIYSEPVNQYAHVLQRFLFCSYVLLHSMYYSQQMTDDVDLLQSNSFMLPLQESGKDKQIIPLEKLTHQRES